MTTSPDSQGSKSSYFINAEDSTEIARLFDQDMLVTKSMGGIFPERADDLDHIHTILDIACGPGGWALRVAREYLHVQVTGISLPEQMDMKAMFRTLWLASPC